MKRINSRAKGARGERQLRDQFREAGFLKAHRGQQFSGLQGAPDVVVPELPSLHFECKCTERSNLYDWLAQAERDASGKGIVSNLMPIVCHKKNQHEWVAILSLKDLLDLIRETNRVQL